MRTAITARRNTPTIVVPSGVAGLQFRDEATQANFYAQQLKSQGVKVLVLVIHQGGFQVGSSLANTAIAAIASQLDPEFDVIVAGHTHSYNNAVLPTNGGQVLVTQAYSNSTAYSNISLLVDPRSKDVMSATAQIITTYAECPATGACPAEVAPGLAANVAVNAPDVLKLVDDANNQPAVKQIANKVVGHLSGPVLRDGTGLSSASESQLGDLIADAQRAAMGTDFAFMNPGGIRANLFPEADGTVYYRQIFDVQPFGNSLVKMTLTGAQIRTLLEQQFSPPNAQLRVLQVSGLVYGYRFTTGTAGEVLGILRVKADGTTERIDDTASYTVTVNSFLADGGDGFTLLKDGTNRVGGPIDLDALDAWLTSSVSGPTMVVPALGRITRCPAGSTLDVCTK